MKQHMLEHTIERIKEQGGRVTIQRIAIINVLLRLGHPTAEEIYKFMQKEFPTLSFTTVYNTLKSLKELGVVREYPLSERSRFEIVEKLHPHFHCVRCDQLLDVEEEYVQIKIDPQCGSKYKPTEVEIILHGVCPNCR